MGDIFTSCRTFGAAVIDSSDTHQHALLEEARALRTVEELRAVHRAAIRLNHAVTPAELAAETIRVLEDTLGYDHAAVLLTDEYSNRLIPFALSDQGRGSDFVRDDKAHLTAHEISVDKGITGWVASHGQSVRAGDVSRDARYYGLRDDIASELCVPIRIDGRVAGVVNVETNKRDAYSDSDQSVLEIIAAQIGMTLKNSRLNEQLINAQRMDAVGQLTAGIAHDFNNLLTVINGQAQLLLMQEGLDQTVQDGLSDILRAGEQAAETTRQLLAFSRKTIIAPSVFDPVVAIENLRPMLTRMLGDEIELIISADSDTQRIEMDQSQFSQVLINLAINAREAMPEGGRFHVDIGVEHITHGQGDRADTIQPGRYLRITVRDTGIGIDPAIMHAVFEPFFTTKPAGTGLGLSMVHGILRQSGAHIRALNVSGGGACFQIHVPETQMEPEQFAIRPKDAVLPRLDGAVVVTEDDPGVRRLVASLFRNLGYDVITTRSGAEAIDRISAPSTPISLLVSDVVMPEMSGMELVRRLRTTRPDLKVLLMSGYPRDIESDAGSGLSVDGFLLKPVTRSALKRALMDIFDKPRA